MLFLGKWWSPIPECISKKTRYSTWCHGLVEVLRHGLDLEVSCNLVILWFYDLDCIYPIYLLEALTICLWKSCKTSMYKSVFWSCSICATESNPAENSHLNKEQNYCEEELYTISNWLVWGRQATETKISITQVQWVNSTPWWPFMLQMAVQI